jgi:hypothetical protein
VYLSKIIRLRRCISGFFYSIPLTICLFMPEP